MEKEKIVGKSPAGKKPRELDIWVEEEAGEHWLCLWIHQPNSDDFDGRRIRVRKEEFQHALSIVESGAKRV